MLNRVMGASTLLLTGCAFQTPILDKENDRSGFLITKPPIQVLFRGDVTKDNIAFVKAVISDVKTIPYKDYTFNSSTEFRVGSTDMKSDDIEIRGFIKEVEKEVDNVD